MAAVLPAFDRCINVNHLEGKAIHVRDLDIRRECRNGEGDGIAAMQQFILHQCVEDVAHRRRSALDGEDVKFAGWRPTVAHLPGEKFMHDALAATKHPPGHGIEVADDALPQFISEGVGIELQLLDAVFPGVAEQLDAGRLGIVAQEGLEALGQTGRQRNLPAGVGNGGVAAGFFEAETEQGSEGIARRGADPVRVAATGIEKLGHIIAFSDLGELDQLIFEFERTELEQRLLMGARGGGFLGHNFLLVLLFIW